MPKTSPSLATYTTMMRANSKGRPYAKDLNDLFSAFLIKQPLTDHRSLFRNYPSTYTTDEAVKSLGHLQFTHLVSAPNPLDPGNPILTRTTTTFNMSRDMAKTMCQHFINARLAESATDPQNRTIKDRGIWSPTPKGKYMIQDFSQRAQVSISHMQTPLNRIPNFQIVLFERLLDDDQIYFSRPNLTQAFKVMMEWLPTQNLMIDDIGGINSFAAIDSYRDSFFGYQCFEWIMEYTSVVSNDEAESVAAEFILYGWIQQVLDKSDKDLNKKDEYNLFKTNRKTQYYLTDKGRHVLDADAHTLQRCDQAHLNSSTSMTHSISRSQSSTSSSNSSLVAGNNSMSRRVLPITKLSSKREEHTKRLLPTTEESELPNDENGLVIAPQAIITKQKTVSTIYDSAVIIDEQTAYTLTTPSIADSILQIENSSCDFGFSSASSTTQSVTTTIYPESSLVHGENNRKGDINDSNESIVQEQLERLKFTSNYQLVDASNSQYHRLQSILKDPLIRMHFRQFLKTNFCEENINFWVDYTTLLKKMDRNKDDNYGTDNDFKRQREIQLLPAELTESLLAHCCVIYNMYFCPQNAPSELNIDHGLRFDIIQYMQATFMPPTSFKSAQQKESMPALGVEAPFSSISISLCGNLTSSVTRSINATNASSVMKQGIEDSPLTCLYKILRLYDLVNDHVCKTMAEDSVPRFIKTKEYQNLIKKHCHQDHSRSAENDQQVDELQK